MIVTVVSVWVKKEHIEDFKKATLENHLNSIKEQGNLRFDVLQSREDPARFFLYEAYESDEAAAAHKKTAHYLKWRDAVAPWMEKPREGIACSVVCPQDKMLWNFK
ncbi:MAG: antibiotic biosynthesis monooxygenase [Thermoplasmata archaeon]